ncbi:MAG TPA: nucleotidyl transferase AbiEii/AbiGii toxin family protein [Xanthobacteraceae bacterium]|nr:nucleotidyl transferase AbiEii/AbiGii toxin family protein [Xanthobacteraceae bacterium]
MHDYAAAKGVRIIDNRAKGVACYDPGYTLVEKLQTISTKYRQWEEKKEFPINFMRHYYDVYCLLGRPEVQAFIGTEEYKAHKTRRFRQADNPNIAENRAFALSDPARRKLLEEAYDASKALYYGDKPNFGAILNRIVEWVDKL